MTTTTATSSPTPSPTTTKTAASIQSSAAQSLLTSLNSGSGIDSATLVSQLVDAQFAAKRAQLTSKYDTLSAQISGAASLKSTITDFNNALANLVKGGTLASQPVVGTPAVLGATLQTGGKVSGLDTSVTVSQLATAQAATSAKIANPASTTFAAGTLSIQIGTASYDANGAMTGFAGNGAAIDVTVAANSSLSDIAKAINAAKTGVTATVVNDGQGGAFLSLKGATGAAQAFTIASSGGDLSRFELSLPAGGSGMSVTTTPKNAKLTVDGVAVERASNEITDLVAGVKLNLTATGTTQITASRSTTALTTGIKDFVDTYNQVLATVKEQTDPINGVLRGDPAARGLLKSLQGLTSKVLLPGAAAGAPSSLAAIGVRTNRDGTLSVDEDAVTNAMTNFPDAVESMFAFDGSNGIFGAMQSLQLSATSSVYGLGASTSRYTSQRSDVTEAQGKIADKATVATTRLTQQFASMNARVSAYKATQAYMTQQIDMWTKSGS